MAFRVHGRGPRAVVLVPGMCVSSEMFSSQVGALTADARNAVLLVDNRASGGSSWPSEGYDMETMARDVWAVVDAVFGRTGRVHLVGHSMGSMIAQRAAILRTGRVGSLCVLGGHEGGWFWSWVPTGKMVAAAWEMVRGGFGARVLAEVHLGLHYTEGFLEEREWDGGRKVSRRERYLERYCSGGGGGGGEAFWRHLAAVRSHWVSKEEAERLREAGFEKVVVYGREDRVVLPRACKELARRIGAEAVMVGGAHFFVDEAAAEVNAVLEGVLERADGVGEGREGRGEEERAREVVCV